MIAEDIKNSFNIRVTEALSLFPNTIGQCVALCAYVSSGLEQDGVHHSVAVGSLSCNGIKTFQYKRAFSSTPNIMHNWEGHAWIEFSDGVIGDPSLIRTARHQGPTSNLRRHLESLDLLSRGALLMDANARKEDRLKYYRKSYLKPKMFTPLIDGLKAMNA